MRYTQTELKTLLNDVNYLLNRNFKTWEIAKRNGFIYIQDIETGKTYFNNAVSTKSLYLQLYAFREGLYVKIDE